MHMLSGLELIHFDSSLTTTQVHLQLSSPRATEGLFRYRVNKVEGQLASRVAKWDQALGEIRELGLLQDNWDGYGARGVTVAAVENVLHAFAIMSASVPAIQVPDVCPTPSGTISLTWDDAGTDAVLEFGVSRYSGYVQIRNQPVIYLDGSATMFGQDDCAVLTAALHSASPSRTVNVVSIGRAGFDDRMAA